MKKMKKAREKFRPKSMTVICLLVALSMLTVWAAGMYCLTAVTAEYAAERYYNKYDNYAGDLTHHVLEYNRTIELEEKYENFEKSRMWDFVSYGNRVTDTSSFSSNIFPYLNRAHTATDLYGVCAVFDGDKKLIVNSEEDYFYFEYMNEDEWNSGQERSMQNMRVLFDRDLLTADMKEWLKQHKSIRSKARALRFSGYYDDTVFIPTLIEYIDNDEFQTMVPWFAIHPVSTATQKYCLTWKTMYVSPNAAKSDSEIVTLYSDWFDVCYYRSSPSFKYLGKSYDNITQLADEIWPQILTDYQQYSESRYISGATMIIPSLYCCFDVDGTTHYGTSHNQYTNDEKTVHYYTLCIIYCSPWLTAAMELKNIYVITFVLTAAIVTAILLIIRRHLVKPVQAVGEALCNDDPLADISRYQSRKWFESDILQIGFKKSQNTKQQLNDEIARLNKSLDYAKTAEENRRRMVSDIAHELKTPLAVIHSYAEGIKEHIAEEKRDKYIDVILHEAQRTDLMVLQMLDLSRLEAGRVKLMREPFSLIETVREVFGRLDMLAREKELSIEYVFPKDFEFNADRARITQVVENLASNAIKYTPQGGKIIVRVLNDNGSVSFTVENQSQPMSKETLKNVWEVFYRADESRSGGGTGLGLAIVKNIVMLHGGACIARNTAMGVQFGFTI